MITYPSRQYRECRTTDSHFNANHSDHIEVMWPSPKTAHLLLLARAALLASASPIDLTPGVDGGVVRRQCPPVHVFGARETTASAGYGSSITVVDDVLNAYSGATAEAINYPACGGQSSCGGVSYANSVVDGINAVVTAVENFYASCPDTQLVLVGYSQVSILCWSLV